LKTLPELSRNEIQHCGVTNTGILHCVQDDGSIAMANQF